MLRKTMLILAVLVLSVVVGIPTFAQEEIESPIPYPYFTVAITGDGVVEGETVELVQPLNNSAIVRDIDGDEHEVFYWYLNVPEYSESIFHDLPPVDFATCTDIYVLTASRPIIYEQTTGWPDLSNDYTHSNPIGPFCRHTIGLFYMGDSAYRLAVAYYTGARYDESSYDYLGVVEVPNTTSGIFQRAEPVEGCPFVYQWNDWYMSAYGNFQREIGSLCGSAS